MSPLERNTGNRNTISAWQSTISIRTSQYRINYMQNNVTVCWFFDVILEGEQTVILELMEVIII